MKAANKFYLIEVMGTDKEKETAGGIIIRHNDESELAKVLSAGPQVENPYPEGTLLSVNWQHVVPITRKGKRVFIIHADSIFAEIDD